MIYFQARLTRYRATEGGVRQLELLGLVLVTPLILLLLLQAPVSPHGGKGEPRLLCPRLRPPLAAGVETPQPRLLCPRLRPPLASGVETPEEGGAQQPAWRGLV